MPIERSPWAVVSEHIGAATSSLQHHFGSRECALLGEFDHDPREPLDVLIAAIDGLLFPWVLRQPQPAIDAFRAVLLAHPRMADWTNE